MLGLSVKATLEASPHQHRLTSVLISVQHTHTCTTTTELNSGTICTQMLDSEICKLLRVDIDEMAGKRCRHRFMASSGFLGAQLAGISDIG